MPDEPPPPTSDRRHAKSGPAARIGVVLVLLSGVFWFSLFAIPFLPMTVGHKAALAGALFVAVQIAWWSGAVLLGPQAIARLKSRFRFRKKTDD